MTLTRLLGAAAAVTLFAGPAMAQATAPASPAPAAPAAAAPAQLGPGAANYQRIAPAGDIFETLKASPQFSILVEALQATALSGTLKANPHLTFFAPTDAAFNAAYSTSQIHAWLQGTGLAELQHLLAYHLINATVDSTKIKGTEGPVPSVVNTPLYLNGLGDPLKVNDANIIQADINASNGTIQVIDRVLKPDYTPPAAAPAPAPTPAPATPQTH